MGLPQACPMPYPSHLLFPVPYVCPVLFPTCSIPCECLSSLVTPPFHRGRESYDEVRGPKGIRTPELRDSQYSAHTFRGVTSLCQGGPRGWVSPTVGTRQGPPRSLAGPSIFSKAKLDDQTPRLPQAVLT